MNDRRLVMGCHSTELRTDVGSWHLFYCFFLRLAGWMDDATDSTRRNNPAARG
jgi:hypothetical protein